MKDIILGAVLLLIVGGALAYIIRANMADFSQVAFIGKGGIHNCGAPW